MSDLNAIESYGRYRAQSTFAGNQSSATDLRLIDVALTEEEGSIGLFVAGLTITSQRDNHLFLQEINKKYRPSIRTGSVVNYLIEGDENTLVRSSEFAALDYLRTPEGRIKQQIRDVRADNHLTYRERLARRLEFLVDMAKEQGEIWNEDSPQSLRIMLKFLHSVEIFRYPAITITPSATFRAQWTIGPDMHFAAEFLADGQALFVVFARDPFHKDRIQRASGITSWENLLCIIGPYEVQRWAENAGE